MNKDEILKREIDDDELQHVVGGNLTNGISTGWGGCTQNYYVDSCKATVEPGSHCGLSSDSCALWNVYKWMYDENGKKTEAP